jgi:hypothetical protein
MICAGIESKQNGRPGMKDRFYWIGVGLMVEATGEDSI